MFKSQIYLQKFCKNCAKKIVKKNCVKNYVKDFARLFAKFLQQHILQNILHFRPLREEAVSFTKKFELPKLSCNSLNLKLLNDFEIQASRLSFKP